MKLFEIFDPKSLGTPSTSLLKKTSMKRLKSRFGRHITRDKDGLYHISIGDGVMNMDESDWKSALLPFKDDVDYEWWVAYGDTHPHSVTIKNPIMLEDEGILEFLEGICGNSPY